MFGSILVTKNFFQYSKSFNHATSNFALLLSTTSILHNTFLHINLKNTLIINWILTLYMQKQLGNLFRELKVSESRSSYLKTKVFQLSESVFCLFLHFLFWLEVFIKDKQLLWNVVWGCEWESWYLWTASRVLDDFISAMGASY